MMEDNIFNNSIKFQQELTAKIFGSMSWVRQNATARKSEKEQMLAMLFEYVLLIYLHPEKSVCCIFIK